MPYRIKCPKCKSFMKEKKLRACSPWEVGWKCIRCDSSWIFKTEGDYQGTHVLNDSIREEKKKLEKLIRKRNFNPTRRVN